MIRVLLAEPMSLIRGAIAALLADEPDIDVVAELERGSQILPTALTLRPDVALIDIDSPDKDGLSAVDELQKRLPESRTLLLTSARTGESLRQALSVVNGGGIIAKDAPPADLLEGVRKVAVGHHFIDSDLALAALRERDNPLTSREREVLGLAADGTPVIEMAAHLFLSPRTVRNYLSQIRLKLEARNLIDAIRIAQDASWI
jgi:two-component system, NarL family, response regulator DesR